MSKIEELLLSGDGTRSAYQSADVVGARSRISQLALRNS